MNLKKKVIRLPYRSAMAIIILASSAAIFSSCQPPESAGNELDPGSSEVAPSQDQSVGFSYDDKTQSAVQTLPSLVSPSSDPLPDNFEGTGSNTINSDITILETTPVYAAEPTASAADSNGSGNFVTYNPQKTAGQSPIGDESILQNGAANQQNEEQNEQQNMDQLPDSLNGNGSSDSSTNVQAPNNTSDDLGFIVCCILIAIICISSIALRFKRR